MCTAWMCKPGQLHNHWWRKLLKVRGSLLHRGDFLLRKLNSYGEALNSREAMVPLFPPPMCIAGCQLIMQSVVAKICTVCCIHLS